MAVPVWASLVARWSYIADALFRAHDIVRDEVLLAFLPEAARDEYTLQRYQRLRTFLPGGEIYDQGLLAWEEAMLGRHEIPRQGTVVLLAAGGGRELAALDARGYRVIAVEPVPAFAAALRDWARQHSSTTVVQATFRELMDAGDALRSNGAGDVEQTIDLVYFGWGGFSHVLEHGERVALLATMRRLAPAAPVLFSFWKREAEPRSPGPSERLRRTVRQTFRRLGGNEIASGTTIRSPVGFGHSFTAVELGELAAACGYRVAHLEMRDIAHALLLPETSA